jgi:hypothetical protein
MYGKFRLIANIENTSIEEILVYLKRLLRIYFTLVIFSIIGFVSNLAIGETVAAIIAIVGVVLYVIHMTALYFTSQTPTNYHSITTVITALILLVYNIADIVYSVSNGNLWGLLSFIGVVLQCTTIYILYKLHEKIVYRMRNPDLEQGLGNPTAPGGTALEAIVSPSNPHHTPMATTVPYGSTTKNPVASKGNYN